MNALRIQNRYMTKVKMVILVGIVRSMMSDLRPLLLAQVHIDQVAATRKLDSIGCWDVLTEDQHRMMVIDTITENLPSWLAASSTDPDGPDQFPEPGILTRSMTARKDSSAQRGQAISRNASPYKSPVSSTPAILTLLFPVLTAANS